MRPACYILALLALFMQGCGRSGLYERQGKTLDSLGVALNIKVKEITKTDTALLQRCITRYTYYRQFIKQSINDTVSKGEAQGLQHFYASGKSLENFRNNRFAILSRATLMSAQQSRLAADIKSRALEPSEAEQHLAREKAATALLVEVAEAQQKLFYTSVEEFKTSLREVEQLIRSHNNGQLPTIVRDTLSL